MSKANMSQSDPSKDTRSKANVSKADVSKANVSIASVSKASVSKASVSKAHVSKDRAMAISIYAVGIFAGFLFLASKSSLLMEVLAPPPADAGDLYDLARVRQFREELPPRGRTRSPLRVDDPNEADVLIFGDSFLWGTFAEAQFPDVLADRLGCKVWLGGRRPLIELEGVLTDLSRERTILRESVDRFVDLDFGWELTMDWQPPAPQPPWLEFAVNTRLRWFRNTELNYHSLLRNFALTKGAVNTVTDLRFQVLGEISEKTPVHQLDPPTLFYYQNVGAGSFYKGIAYQHTDEEVDRVARHLVQLEKRLYDRFRARLVFMGIPNKYVLYGPGAEEQYDQFLPRVQAALSRSEVPHVDVYTPFRKSSKRLFWGSDTHWNGDGLEIGVQQAVRVIQPLLEQRSPSPNPRKPAH